MADRPDSNSDSRNGPACGSTTVRTATPMISVTGKPTENTDSCWAARFRMPIARLMVSRAQISGSASSRPDTKMVLPHSTTAPQPF
ncbi:hypothetical protein D3C72_1739030 [compost metagenome]